METSDKVQRAVELKATGKCNCAQSIACTYCEYGHIDETTARQATAAFGNGMGNMEGTCGTLSGAAVVIGFHCQDDRLKAMKMMKSVMTKFAARNGATQCKVLKGVGTGQMIRACNDCVADTASILEEVMQEFE